MKDASSPFSRKQAQIIQRALTQLAGAKSYKPIRSIEDFGEAPFGRALQLTNHRMVLLTDHGMTLPLFDVLHSHSITRGGLKSEVQHLIA